MMKCIFCLTGLFVLASSPVWGQSYEYIQQSQIADMQADMQSQHEEMERQQQEMHQEMEQTRLEMLDQRNQMIEDRVNAEDYARYH